MIRVSKSGGIDNYEATMVEQMVMDIDEGITTEADHEHNMEE
jgi:hypothetical protein